MHLALREIWFFVPRCYILSIAGSWQFQLLTTILTLTDFEHVFCDCFLPANYCWENDFQPGSCVQMNKQIYFQSDDDCLSMNIIFWSLSLAGRNAESWICIMNRISYFMYHTGGESWSVGCCGRGGKGGFMQQENHLFHTFIICKWIFISSQNQIEIYV